MKAQEAFFFVELDFNQVQQLLVRGLAVQTHVEQAVQAPDFSVPGFVFQLTDVAAGEGDIVSIEQRNRLTQCFGFQQHSQRIGVYGIFTDQRRDHGALVRHYLQQRLRFKLAQRFTHRHAADPEQRRQLLLAQGPAGWQAAIENGAAQPLFNHTTSQVRRHLLAAQYFAQRSGFFGHALRCP
ncbi:hypothetical protein D3C77_318210 [compost metagenome]